MGFSPSSFAGAGECGVDDFVRTGLKARHYKTSALCKQRPRILMGNKTSCANARKHALRNGFVSGVMRRRAKARPLQLPREFLGATRPAGTREALPGTICETFVPHFLRRTLDIVSVVQRKSLSVGKHLLHGGYVGFVYERQLLEFAHAAGGFRAHQVALAGMATLDFAVGGDLEAFSGAAMRL
jgi:hypothetical protein